MKAELHTPINQKDRTKLATAQLPTYDAGSTEDLRKGLKWLGIDYYRENELPDWAVLTANRGDSLTILHRTVPDKTIPSVIGMGLKDAIYLLENRGCRVRVQGVGKVRKQSLAPGTRTNGNQVCVLFLE